MATLRPPLKGDAHGPQVLKRTASVSFVAIEGQREDLAELKRKVEDEIRRDEQKLAFVRDRLGRSAAIEAEMGRTLAQFDERLLTLESSIQPINRETLKLTRAQENLQTVADLLKEAIHYQGVSREMQKIVSVGITNETLDGYIEALHQISDALEHFQTNAPENPEGRTLALMDSAALRSLEAEFERVLQEESARPTQEELLAMKPMDVLEGTSMMSDGALLTLSKITSHMVEKQITNEIFYVYARVRGSIVAGIDGEGAGADAALFSPTRREKTGRRMMNSIRRKSTSHNLDMNLIPGREDSGGAKRIKPKGHGRAPSFDKNQRDFAMDPDVSNAHMYEKGSHPYFIHFSALLVALQREQALVQKLVPKTIAPQLARAVMNPAMDNVLTKGEALVGSMSRRSPRGPAGLCLLDIMKLFRTRRNEIRAILETCSSDVGQRFSRLVDSIAQLGHRSLVEFQDSTQGDNVKSLPPDGTVHELTSNTLKYLAALCDYGVVTGHLLGTNGVLSQDDAAAGPMAGFEPTDAIADSLVSWFISVLQMLCENLSRKARTYEEPSLAAIFLVNNYDHVLKHILASPHIAIYRRNDPNIDTRYLDRIRQQRDHYKSSTWEPIAAFLRSPATNLVPGALSKKEREMVKDKYSGFNETFDATLETQQQYSIPNSELRDQIRQENSDSVLPLFQAFDDTYRGSGFTQKNPHKYLKYTVVTIEHRMQEFFKSK